MQTSQSFEPGKKTFLDDTIPLSERVNFPSTAEIFHAVFENSFHANCIGNDRGKILEANEQVCKIFGYTQEEMTRLSIKEIFDTTDSNYAEFQFQREFNEKVKAVVTGIRKSGEHFQCEFSSIIFISDNGETRTINTMHDISKNYIDRA